MRFCMEDKMSSDNLKLETVEIAGRTYIRALGRSRDHVIVRMGAGYGSNQPGDICGLPIDVVKRAVAGAMEPVTVGEMRRLGEEQAARLLSDRKAADADAQRLRK